MEPTKKKKIIIVLILILIVGVIVFMLTRKTTTTNTGTNGTKTGVDLGQLDPTKQGKNPDGTDIISGTLPGTGSTTNNDGTYTNYTGINTNGAGGTGQNTGGNNGTGSGIGGNGGGGNGNGGGLIDLSGGNGSGGGTDSGNTTSNPCTKAPNDMTTAERDLCIGPAGGATPTEDNTLILTDAQRRQLDDLDRTFYRTAPALANPDILADYIDEVKNYDDTHNKLKTNINQCLAIIDDASINPEGFQFKASYLGIDGRTWYRGNPKQGYTPGFNRVAGNIPIGNPVTWRPKDLSIITSPTDPTYPSGAYYYLKYYGETSFKNGIPFIDAFSRRGGASFTTALESKFGNGWFDRGTFLRTNTNIGNGKEDAENLRQFEELFEIY